MAQKVELPRPVLKFKYSMPIWMEQKLIHKYKFIKVDSLYNQYQSFRKPAMGEVAPKVPPKATTLIDVSKDLSLTVQAELLRRCDNIVSHFPAPYEAIPAVRTRLHNAAQTCRTLAERQFILDFMEEEFPLEKAG